jgi:hypothetical protein
MLAEKAVSEKTLQRLWSEIALLRQQVEQAHRNRAVSQERLTSVIAATQSRLQPRSNRYR